MLEVANITENSMEISDPREVSNDSNEPSFSIVDNISQRGKPKLFEKQGYSYTYWRQTTNKSKSFFLIISY